MTYVLEAIVYIWQFQKINKKSLKLGDFGAFFPVEEFKINLDLTYANSQET